MREEEPWPTLNTLWCEIYAYRDELYLQQGGLKIQDPLLAILQAKLDATRDIQKMLFDILRTKQKELKNVDPS